MLAVLSTYSTVCPDRFNYSLAPVMKMIVHCVRKVIVFRIRTVPTKDARYTPKLAVIKNELHPDRTTVNIYVRFADESSVQKVAFYFGYFGRY